MPQGVVGDAGVSNKVGKERVLFAGAAFRPQPPDTEELLPPPPITDFDTAQGILNPSFAGG